jgi:predicted metal-dependent peptidase
MGQKAKARTVEELREAVKKCIARLLIAEPFIGVFSKMTNIYYAKDSPGVAWTDGRSIHLGAAASGMPLKDIAYVIAHEAMHIILKHPLRTRQILRRHPELAPEQLFKLANYVADAFVYMYLSKTAISPTNPSDLVKPDDIRRRFGVSIEGKSFEEVMEEIIKSGNVEVEYGGGCIGDYERPSGSELLNEGAERDDEEMDEESIEREVNRRIADAYNAAKGAGRVPEELERLVNELLKPKVDWRAIIRRDLSGFFGSRYRHSWKRMSKKQPGLLPGRKNVGSRGDALILVDTSGSISERELQQFVAEAFAVAKAAGRNVLVIPWDAKAYEPVVIRRNEDVKNIKVRLKGGGGTVIMPALKAAEQYMRPTTKVVILSDWDISDIKSPEVQAWLKKYRSQIFAVTTLLPPPSFLQYVKIEL